MDMLPPQPPPALSQSVYQQAAQAFDRVVGMQAWLAAEQAAIPQLPAVIDTRALAPFLADVDAYWSAPPIDASMGRSRYSVLTERLGGAAINLAVLSHEDGNLDEASMIIVRSVVAARSVDLLPGLDIRELMFGSTPYAGVLLIRDKRVPDRALVFSIDRGWESFPDLSHAHAKWEQRARRDLASASALPGIARQHLVDLGPDAFVSSRDISGDPFKVMASRIIEAQRDKLQQAWFEFGLAGSTEGREQNLRDMVFAILQMDRAIDIPGALATRHAAMVETFNAQRLSQVPATVADEWKEAEDAYASTLRGVRASEAGAGLAAPQTLQHYAIARLGQRLQARGITQAAEDIHVRIDRSGDPGAWMESFATLFNGAEPVYIPLVDLAYQNIELFSPQRLSASGSDNITIPALDDGAIRAIVTELNLALSYPRYLDSTFLTGRDAAQRRESASSVQLSLMRLRAAEARLAYYLDDVPRWFRTERAERGYQWIKAVLDAPASTHRARVEGHEIVVEQITYCNTPVRDILVIGVRDPRSVPNVVLYTPDAPDGITFREFDDRNEAGKKFFYNPDFREYLLDRLTAEHAEVLPNGSGRKFAGNDLAHFVFGSPSSAGYTKTADRFREREVTGDFLDAGYDVDVQHGIRNTQTFTRSASDAHFEYLVDRQLSILGAKLAWDLVKGVVTLPAQMANAGWRLYDNVKAGDHAQAFVDFADFYAASLGLVQPLYATSRIPVARGIVGGRFLAAGKLVEARPPTPPAAVFEPRFVAKGIQKTGRPNRDGIFETGNKRYIEHEGKMYAVRYDRDYATWRLTRDDASPTSWGPAIQRTAGGTWTYHEVGLLGGSGRGAAGNTGQRAGLFDEYMYEAEQAFPDPVERELVVARMRSELTGGSNGAPITPAQRARWNEAARRAADHATSALPPASMNPLDLRLPRGFRAVLNHDVPEQLWFYGQLPFKESDLIRTLGQKGYSTRQASLRTTQLTPSTSAVRVTTVPPTAPIEEIQLAMANPYLNRSSTFAVRIDGRRLHQLSNGGFMATELPVADLITATGPASAVYHIRPRVPGVFRLYNGQFEVLSKLPKAD